MVAHDSALALGLFLGGASSCRLDSRVLDPALAGVNFPTLGCWEIKGQYQDAQVTYVGWIAQ